MKTLLKNVKAILPNEEKICDIRISDGLITEIGDNINAASDETVKECNGAIVMPGFIDTHIHGGLSRGFLNEDTNLEEIMKSAAKRGTTGMTPTFSGRPQDVFFSAMSRVADFAKTNKTGAKILGIHSEGPCLNPVRAGGMIPEYFVTPSVEYFNQLYKTCNGLLKIITIAPEMPGAIEMIKEAVKNGVAVSAGHTNATYDEMKKGIDAGISRVTHTFNAIRPLSHREPGAIGAAFTDKRVNCEAICDFGHLHPATVKLIIQQKGIDGVTVVSDYSDRQGKAAKGEGEHEFDGQKYVILNGVAWTLDGGVISNSNDMLVSVRNLYSIGFSLVDIAIMASANPAKAVGAFDKTGSIEIGKAADLVLLDNELNIINTYVDGKLL